MPSANPPQAVRLDALLTIANSPRVAVHRWVLSDGVSNWVDNPPTAFVPDDVWFKIWRGDRMLCAKLPPKTLHTFFCSSES